MARPQSRVNPPALIPLRDIATAPLDTLRKRLRTYEILIFPRRPYVAEEIEEIGYINCRLHGTPYNPPKRRKLSQLSQTEKERLASELLA